MKNERNELDNVSTHGTFAPPELKGVIGGFGVVSSAFADGAIDSAAIPS